MDLLPLFIKINGQPCLVVGGGEVAARKVDLLLRAGAKVAVVSTELCPTLASRHQAKEIQWIKKAFQVNDIGGAKLVVAATSEQAVNQLVSEEAKAKGLPVNVVDQPDLCSFYFPAIIDRSPVVIAVSTGGKAPVLARLIRTKLESMVPSSYGKLASLVGKFRETVKLRITQSVNRKRFWENVLQGTVAEKMLSGREAEAELAVKEVLSDMGKTEELPIGEVYLVGAGPGDPDLLTFRALRLMQQADVVLHDRLVSDAILDLVRRDAERIYVGKQRSFHAVRQEEISGLLANLAKKGKRVLRLKGGDPFIFGRGGEEIEVLASQNIPFQVVPGVTAASGCACYAGIPLTHRDYAQSVVFVTGHGKEGAEPIDWKALVQPQQTIVIYMGLLDIEKISTKLVNHGMSADMPVALVEQGTMSSQRVHIGTLSTIPTIIKNKDVHAPTLIIVGEVVNLHETLKWQLQG